ncbi:hypothetical protein GC194_04690, partial [bacterium]|nr:hypothetical protein [bacterium]
MAVRNQPKPHGIKNLFLMMLVLAAWQVRAHAQCGSFSISANDSQICLNQVVTFKAHNIPALSKYTWYLGLDTIVGTDLDTVSTGYYKLGQYNIKLKIKLKNG